METQQESKFTHSFLTEASFSASGRRDFLDYRDLGLAEATGGRVGGSINRVKRGVSLTTGWHYHEVEHQILYVLKGELDIQIAGMEGTQTFTEGTFFYIPGGTPHNELRLSADHEGYEITIPAKIGTVSCDPPPGF